MNRLGFRTCQGNEFQSYQTQAMLADPVYLGYYTYNKYPHGKFKSFKGGKFEDESNYDEKRTRNTPADYVQSERLFAPLIDRKTWEKVQEKLANTAKRDKSVARSPTLYLSGLLYCGNCGAKMFGRAGTRPHYFCSTWFKHLTYGHKEDSPCIRNHVYQADLDGYLNLWLEESGKRLAVITEGFNAKNLTGNLKQKADDRWRAFSQSLDRIQDYLNEYHRGECGDLVEPDGTVDTLAVLKRYRQLFDPAKNREELARLEAEHDGLMENWKTLRTERARDKATKEFEILEARIKEVEAHKDDAADVVEKHWRELRDVQKAIQQAKASLRGDSETALRRRMQALRGVLHRIECFFVATGVQGRGKGKTAQMVKIVFHPVSGETLEYERVYDRNLHQVPATTVK